MPYTIFIGLIVALAIAVTVWLFRRHRRIARPRKSIEGTALNLQWARESLEKQRLPVTAENLVEITGGQVNEWQARVWLASQAEGSHEPEEA